MYRIRVNPLAFQDLQEIKAYIAEELCHLEAAVSVVKMIISRYEQLREFPLLGKELSALINVKTDFRYLISGNYLIFYRVDVEYVSIYRILYGRRDYMRILFGELQDDVE
ncbi:type II toxin-antitoxin system RelE/ParE family toxin [Paenibacillus arenilitoris]|uniref:Type II toxin-antitoxin system RelE/ParE family toxin n=1 Tax=Paenibacillus arenilitoris TaxID=2772299 RepID=A0A927CME3_9BACL|nr:type II toxin-antitoxin system RelE/ParE family toxin [Paenibacillus arenilitoris]MBD2868836.1 type II toxin-antitoxin system RelE/ParE family toxin [Paenibacillus arenilitoris]